MEPSGAKRNLLAAICVLIATFAPTIAGAQLQPLPARSPLADLQPAPAASFNPFSRQVHFVPNTFLFWDSPLFATTRLPEGCQGRDCTPVPAYANVLLENSNFLQCKGGPFALCYYSGPSQGGTGSADLSCELTPDGRFANCNCYQIPYGTYFVDINAILNYPVYLQTVATCGKDGSGCQNHANMAPVCSYINNQTLIPGADLLSAFSFDCIPTNGLGVTNCGQAPYAGCMTAPCYRTSDTAKTGIVQCSCPVYNGPYQVGADNQECTLGDDLVWSAAYNPDESGTTPATSGCFPDAPGALGCPLLPRQSTPYVPPPGISCTKVCQEYTTCSSKGIQAGYTCDSTLCTAQCDDRDLSQQACSGLTTESNATSACDISEIAKAEEAAQCSCCASQLCGCNANTPTQHAIYDLNALQRDRGITPQCDQNGTLCGTP